MKATELIEQLRAIIDERGDLPVYDRRTDQPLNPDWFCVQTVYWDVVRQQEMPPERRLLLN